MTTEINLADVIPFDRGRRARQRGRCGSIHPMFPHVPCQRPRAHGERYEHGSHGWDGAGRKGFCIGPPTTARSDSLPMTHS